MPFISCQEGNATDIFIKESEIIDRFVGNQLWTWGYNNFAGLGNFNTINQSSPVQTVSTGTNWKQIGMGNYSVGSSIKTDGTLWVWGRANAGILGINCTIAQSSPVQTVSSGTNWKQVSVSRYNVAAVKTDGTLWLWGCNNYGRLGNFNTINQSSPVQTVSTGTNWKQVGMGNYFATAIKTDGTLWLWGENTCGQLGNFKSIRQSSPVQTVSTGTNWKQVSAGGSGFGAAAIKTDGTLWLWGGGSIGMLGNLDTNTRHSSPVQTVSTGTNWKQVAFSWQHVSALKTDGTLWMWGYNGKGNLGTNDTISRSSPVQTVSTGTNWKSPSFGLSLAHSAAIKTDGTLWLWGCNACGELGTNDTISRSSPVQTMSSGANWKQVSVGRNITHAITFTEF